MSRFSRVSGNAVAILLSDGTNKAATFALYALVARHLGTLEFAQLSLALTLLYTFQVFALAGLRTLTTREVAKDKTKTEAYLVNGSAIAITSSLVSVASLWLFTRTMNYASDMSFVISLLSLSLFSSSLSSLCEAIFQAWEKMYYTAYTNVPINIITIVTAFLLLSQGHGLFSLVILLLLSSTVSMVIKWGLLVYNITRPALRIDFRAAVQMARSALTFLGMDSFIAILGSVNFVLLSKMGGKEDVGLYNATTQVIAPVALIYQGIIASIFPIMCRKYEKNFHTLRPIAEYLTELLLIIAMPTAVGLFFLADSVALLLYGNKDFLLAVGALQIVVWTLITTVFTSVFGQVLIASLKETITLRIVVINTVMNVIIGIIFISQFGLIGAAITSLIMGVVNFCQHYVPLAEILPIRALGKLIWKPLLASVCMVFYFALEKSQEGFFTVLPAGSIYFSTFLGLAIWSSGGMHQFKDRYLYGWSK